MTKVDLAPLSSTASLTWMRTPESFFGPVDELKLHCEAAVLLVDELCNQRTSALAVVAKVAQKGKRISSRFVTDTTLIVNTLKGEGNKHEYVALVCFIPPISNVKGPSDLGECPPMNTGEKCSFLFKFIRTQHDYNMLWFVHTDAIDARAQNDRFIPQLAIVLAQSGLCGDAQLESRIMSRRLVSPNEKEKDETVSRDHKLRVIQSVFDFERWRERW